jgi:23S rRNA pseudouridine1911/1915/1917 synthase
MKLTVESRGERLDRAIERLLSALGHPTSVREVRRGLKEGTIRVDGRRRAPGDRAAGGEAISLAGFVPRAEAEIAPDASVLRRARVLFEDSSLLALDKPPGVATAPLAHGEPGTLLGAAVAHAKEIASAGPPLEGGLLHRLDHETSGVVIFAKTPELRSELRAAFKQGAIEKRYRALVFDPAQALGAPRVIETPLMPGPGRERMRAADDPEAKGALSARTELRRLAPLLRGFAWVEAIARTGRRHQVRVHLSLAGAPIVGDPLYGAGVEPPPGFARLGLHAFSLLLPNGRRIEAPIPEDLVLALLALGFSGDAGA